LPRHLTVVSLGNAHQLARSHASTLDRRRVDRIDYLPTASCANLRSMFSNALRFDHAAHLAPDPHKRAPLVVIHLAGFILR
jgi:hypothetical protein